MRLVMLGLNHRTAPVQMREKLAMADTQLDRFLDLLRQKYPQSEAVVLSTCNRMEIYLVRPGQEEPSFDSIRMLLSEHSGLTLQELASATIHRENQQALEHLFAVATGLDSMVLGEHQILGQVRQAYEQARKRQSVGPVLHKVFQQAIAVARQIRVETGIDTGHVSVGSVAVDFAKQIFERFDDKVVVGIGAGYMAKLTLKHLAALNPARLWLVNRSPQRAIDLAKTLGLNPLDDERSTHPTAGPAPLGGARAMEDLDQLLIEADIVLTSTSSPQPVITADRFKPILKQRRSRPLFIIDIAVPRDVDPQVGAMRNVYLYNVDDLQQVVAQTHEQRASVVAQCQNMLRQTAATCLDEVQHRDAGQLIKALRTCLLDIGQAEQERTLRKLSLINPNDPQSAQTSADLIQEHTHRIINKILHLPLSQMDRKRHSDVPIAFYAVALRKLFQIPVPEGFDTNDLSLDELEAATSSTNDPETS